MMKKIILLLGASNDSQGNLSQMAIDRLECAFSLYACNNDVKFLCTGGFGQHFNTTDLPHAEYLKRWLSSQGVKEEDFLPFILSSNTYEDIHGLKDRMKEITGDVLIVITSDFHIKRVRILFEQSIPYENTIYIPAPSHLEEEELRKRKAHEEKAIRLLR